MLNSQIIFLQRNYCKMKRCSIILNLTFQLLYYIILIIHVYIMHRVYTCMCSYIYKVDSDCYRQSCGARAVTKSAALQCTMMQASCHYYREQGDKDNVITLSKPAHRNEVQGLCHVGMWPTSPTSFKASSNT